MSDTTLLVDGKNALYKSVYAAKAGNREGYHAFVLLLRQMVSWINEVKPKSVCVFWDAPRDTVWRRKCYPQYKDRSDSQYIADISEDLGKLSVVARDFFAYLNVRQFARAEMEADDLIYAAATLLHPAKTVIISSDSDMVQIPYAFHSCSIYEPSRRAYVSVPSVNPVWQKALVGDASDSIVGYHGIGPKKSADLLADPCLLMDYVDKNGAKVLFRNLLLIDLSLCPYLLHNKVYVQRGFTKPIAFDKKEVNSLIMKHKVNGLQQEFTSLVYPFEKLS